MAEKVLDYITLNASYTNYDFRGDTTYLISGNLNLDGTTLFEGNTVVKFTTNSSITAVAGSAIEFLSQPYRPVIFTAKDDSSVGEAISGASGKPCGYYANPALNLGSMGSVTLDEFRISYANRGLSVSGASPTIYNAQFVNCGMAFSDINGAVTAENVLFSNIKTNFNATSSTNTIFVQNATFNNNFDLINGSFANTSLYLTNCVFVNVTNESGNLNGRLQWFLQRVAVGSPTVTSAAYPLQRAGAASCYLTSGCAFLDAGSPNADPLIWTNYGRARPPAHRLFQHHLFRRHNFLPAGPARQRHQF